MKMTRQQTTYGSTNKMQVMLQIFSVCLLFLASCAKSGNDQVIDTIKPKGPKPVWGPTITPQMQTVIEKLESFDTPPLYTLSVEQARKAPSPADAAMAVMKDYGIPAPLMKVDTMGMEIPVTGGQIHARIYTPKTGKASYPVIVYYHGGGWVIATIDTYNASAQALAEKSDAVLVSVEYRKGPEFRFPTAHNDAYESYLWALKNAASIKGDPSRVAVAGESAGGNLAAAVSVMARDKGMKIPVHELLVYPIAGYDLTTPSYVKYDAAKPLDRTLMKWFFGNYLANPAQGNDTRINLVKANLQGMPSTTIIAAEIDPLQSEGKMLAERLMASNVPTTYKLYIGVTHEFFGMAAVVPEAKYAQDLAAAELKKAFK